MATTYATHADIARELRTLFPNGFNTTTQPTQLEVAEEITRVTTGLRVRVIRATGVEPSANEDAAALVKRGVVAKVVAWVLRHATLGFAASDVEQLTKPWEEIYREVKEELSMLPDHFKKTTVEQHRVGTTHADHVRDPVLPDDALTRGDLF